MLCIKFQSKNCLMPSDHVIAGKDITLRHICAGCAWLRKTEDMSHGAKACPYKSQFFGKMRLPLRHSLSSLQLRKTQPSQPSVVLCSRRKLLVSTHQGLLLTALDSGDLSSVLHQVVQHPSAKNVLRLQPVRHSSVLFRSLKPQWLQPDVTRPVDDWTLMRRCSARLCLPAQLMTFCSSVSYSKESTWWKILPPLHGACVTTYQEGHVPSSLTTSLMTWQRSKPWESPIWMEPASQLPRTWFPMPGTRCSVITLTTSASYKVFCMAGICPLPVLLDHGTPKGTTLVPWPTWQTWTTTSTFHKELQFGALVGPLPDHLPFQTFCCPLASVPKPKTNSTRTVTDCTNSGYGVNA